MSKKNKCDNEIKEWAISTIIAFVILIFSGVLTFTFFYFVQKNTTEIYCHQINGEKK